MTDLNSASQVYRLNSTLGQKPQHRNQYLNPEPVQVLNKSKSIRLTLSATKRQYQRGKNPEEAGLLLV